MIYAVNKRTKEHRIADEHAWGHGAYKLVEADPDGWIEWYGGECPLPDGARVAVKYDNGKEEYDAYSDSYRWNRAGLPLDIIAYRPILNADTKPEPPAWDGEGLPPVGCEVEALADDEWVLAEWFKKHNGEHAVFFIRSRALGWAKDIRPIRSEEDREAEEMASLWEDAMPVDAFCRALYRAGYRK